MFGLSGYQEKYKYSSAKFYETGVDDPIAIGFGLLRIGWTSAVASEASSRRNRTNTNSGVTEHLICASASKLIF